MKDESGHASRGLPGGLAAEQFLEQAEHCPPPPPPVLSPSLASLSAGFVGNTRARGPNLHLKPSRPGKEELVLFCLLSYLVFSALEGGGRFEGFFPPPFTH